MSGLARLMLHIGRGASRSPVNARGTTQTRSARFVYTNCPNPKNQASVESSCPVAGEGIQYFAQFLGNSKPLFDFTLDKYFASLGFAINFYQEC